MTVTLNLVTKNVSNFAQPDRGSDILAVERVR